MALCLGLLPALAEPAAAPGPLTLEELNAFTERLLVRGMADALPVSQGEDGLGYIARGEGYTLYPESSDLSPDTVLAEAAVTLEAVEKEDLEDQRGITVLTPLDVVYASYPNENPSVYGTTLGAALYLKGELPGAVTMGTVNGYMNVGIQYVIDRALVVGIHYFGGSALKTADEARAAYDNAKSLLAQRDYFAYDTVSPMPLQSEDLSFGELDFLDLTPERAGEVLGEAVSDERVKDSNGDELRVMQWEGVEAAFSYGADGSFKRAERMDVSLPGLEGPRGLRVGTEIKQAIGRFEHGTELNPTQVLYGDGETAPYGRMETQGSEAQLHYALDQNGETIMLMLLFVDDVMVNMSISY